MSEGQRGGGADDVSRRIIHIDMDAFFASVEQRDDPALRGLPVAVGGAGKRGVVAAASYEARIFGVRSAMSGMAARRRCPELIFVRPRFDIYRAVSQQIRRIFLDYTPLVEPLSLDEAYLDVTTDARQLGSATATAEEVRRKIRYETGLTASAGVSYNKFLAKLASDQNKPNRVFVIPPGRGEAFVQMLDIGRFHGVGPVTASRMRALGINTGGDLKERPLPWLRREFGRSADYYHRAARGIDDRPVRPDRERKSIGCENTFADDLHHRDEVIAALTEPLQRISGHIARTGKSGRTMTLKIRYADFRQITRSRTLPRPIPTEALTPLAHDLVAAILPLEKPVRLLGLALTGFTPPEAQFSLALDRDPQPTGLYSGLAPANPHP